MGNLGDSIKRIVDRVLISCQPSFLFSFLGLEGLDVRALAWWNNSYCIHNT